MVNGIDIFRHYFQGFSSDYVLIGGVACELALNSRSLEFRPTDDFDIVIISENLKRGFGSALKNFIRDGGYIVQHRKSNHRPTFFRFVNPVNGDFPAMLELATDKPDEDWSWDFVPLDVGDEKSSLSAILFEKDFYHFIRSNALIINGVSSLPLEGLIPLKCLAVLELSRFESPSPKMLANIEKHRLDIFHLTSALPGGTFAVPPIVGSTIKEALEKMETSEVTETQQEFISALREFYRL